jgi:hypothetical protein
MNLKALSLPEKLSLIDLAIKALVLYPQAIDGIHGDAELADCIVKFAKQIAIRTENLD